MGSRGQVFGASGRGGGCGETLYCILLHPWVLPLPLDRTRPARGTDGNPGTHHAKDCSADVLSQLLTLDHGQVLGIHSQAAPLPQEVVPIPNLGWWFWGPTGCLGHGLWVAKGVTGAREGSWRCKGTSAPSQWARDSSKA
jgi:hypothetical protein